MACRSLAVAVAAVLAGAVLAGAGVFVGWRGFTRSCYVITPPLRPLLPVLAAAGMAALFIGAAARQGWWGSLVLGGLQLLVALAQMRLTLALVGDRSGLWFRRPKSLSRGRVPWSDIERVAFCDGRWPNTVEIGLALRLEAKPRRSTVRRYDTLTDLSCRVMMPRKAFDFEALQRLVAAQPQVVLVERSGAMERVWAGVPAQARP